MATLKMKSGLTVTRGNLKLGNDTIIFNMGSATHCPSAALGLCKLGKRCYALKAEKLYKEVLPYRTKQAEYWNNHSAAEIIMHFDELLRTRKTKKHGKMVRLYKVIKYFRFNEAGDFRSQNDISKLNAIAKHLKQAYQITTYGYSARRDLDFVGVHFLVKGSGWYGQNNGMTIARPKATIEACRDKNGFYQESTIDNFYIVTNGKVEHVIDTPFDHLKFAVCPMDCRDCTLCKKGSQNVVFPLH